MRGGSTGTGSHEKRWKTGQKRGAARDFIIFSFFLGRSGTLIAFHLFREAVRINLALPEKPEPS
jgi:hypothetical protein